MQTHHDQDTGCQSRRLAVRPWHPAPVRQIGHGRADQKTTQDNAKHHRAHGHRLKVTVGTHQGRTGHQLGNQAVFGRRIKSRPNTGQANRQHRVQTDEQQSDRAALESVGSQHDPPFLKGIGNRADEGRQSHIKKGGADFQNGYQPSGSIQLDHAGYGNNQESVIGQRRQELHHQHTVKRDAQQGAAAGRIRHAPLVPAADEIPMSGGNYASATYSMSGDCTLTTAVWGPNSRSRKRSHQTAPFFTASSSAPVPSKRASVKPKVG